MKTPVASGFQVYLRGLLLLLGLAAVPAGAADSNTSPEREHDHLSSAPSLTEPCRDTPALVSPEYPQPAYSTAQIARRFKRPKDVTDLLDNLKRIFDDNLLVQPNFFTDDTLLTAFNGRALRWVTPGAPDFGGDRLIRPTKVARLSLAEPFSGLTVEIGLNHQCFNSRQSPFDPPTLIPAHTYDSGYLRVKVAAPMDSFTLGAVRRVFGVNPGRADPACKEPLPISYPTRSEPGTGAFFLNVAEFRPRQQGYEAFCKAQSTPELGDDERVGAVLIRVLEDDHTRDTVLQP